MHRLCRENLLYSSINRPKRGWHKSPGPAVHDDLLKRDFTAKSVNEKWLLDIAEHATSIGKLHLCTIIDCSSRRIVGNSIDLREPVKTIVRSDRSSLFRSKDFTTELTKHGLLGSMGRVGVSPVTMLQWNPFLRSCKRTSRTRKDGKPAKSYASKSCTG